MDFELENSGGGGSVFCVEKNLKKLHFLFTSGQVWHFIALLAQIADSKFLGKTWGKSTSAGKEWGNFKC